MSKLCLSIIEGSLPDDFQVIDIKVKTDENVVSVFRGKIDLSELLIWFKDNENAIKSSDFPVKKESSESLARTIHCFFENIDVEDDVLVDTIFDYRSQHCLRFGVRGSCIPEIYIGKSGDKHEISMCNDEVEWKYLIDIDDFFSNLKN